MGFGIYQIGGLPEAQATTLLPVVVDAATEGIGATDLMSANPNRIAIALVNETDKIVYLATGTAITNAASATNKILEIPAKQRILLSGDDCPREALNVAWVALSTGKFEAVERVRI
ncbi:hypothetical protein NG799_02270 [Laspinema sp. D1]|uniref:Uncharacterized protein n=1 Tax=Laspinema palackyanum D2a TaxID=2953684 RepID=A0ABT2MKB5_9CYAN|nr:hypothetical protein [Laspinema sp. D2a]